MGEYVAAFLLEAQFEKAGLSFFIGAACRPLASIRRLSFENPSSIDEGFFVTNNCPDGTKLHIIVLLKTNSALGIGAFV